MKGYCVSKTLQLYGTEPVNSQWTLLFCCTRDCSMSTRNLTGKSEPDPCILYAGLAQSTKPKYCVFFCSVEPGVLVIYRKSLKMENPPV